MTIAACYVSSEGVVLGADSTSTILVRDQPEPHYLNFAQKLFEFGDIPSTVGVVLWGLGAPGNKSWRTLIAEMADATWVAKPQTFEEAATLVATLFWDEYSSSYSDLLSQAKQLDGKGEQRTDDENQIWANLYLALSGGMCLGGRWSPNRRPQAFQITFNPLMAAVPQSQEVPVGAPIFWGCPHLVERLNFGMDEALFDSIFSSEKWTGTREELMNLVVDQMLKPPDDLPLREAIDWVYSSILTTIKGMKFSHLSPVCGGPIEVAVISSDRPFRWVCHKRMGEAIVVQKIEEKGVRA